MSFEGQRYSEPFRLLGRVVEVRGCAGPRRDPPYPSGVPVQRLSDSRQCGLRPLVWWSSEFLTPGDRRSKCTTPRSARQGGAVGRTALAGWGGGRAGGNGLSRVSFGSLKAERRRIRCPGRRKPVPAPSGPAEGGSNGLLGELELGRGASGCEGRCRGREAEVSSAGGSHPQALAEPYVSVSTHTAPIIQPVEVRAAASARRVWDLDGQPRRASALHQYGVP